MNRGRLISFEGLDGAGKTTQMDLLGQWLESQHIPYVRTREPGGTPLGVEIRQLLFCLYPCPSSIHSNENVTENEHVQA